MSAASALGKLLGPARTGTAFVWRRSRLRRYWRQAAVHLWRELHLPGGPDRAERAVLRAVKRTPGLSRRVLAESLVLGSGPYADFAETIDDVAAEVPGVLRDEYGDAELPPDEELRARFRRAARLAVASSADDQVARLVRQSQGSGARVEWRALSLSIGVSAVVGVAAAWGVSARTDATTAQEVVVGLAAALSAQAAGGVAFLSRTGDRVLEAHQALRALVDALLGPNVPGYRPPTLREQMQDRPVAPLVTRELECIVTAAGFGSTMSAHGPPSQEVVYRYDGAERARVREAAQRYAAAMRKLRPHQDWRPPWRLADLLDRLWSGAGSPCSDTWEVEVTKGSELFEVLVCCAAVATELDRALGVPLAEAA